MPLRADDVSVYDRGDDWVRYRLVKKVERKKESSARGRLTKVSVRTK